MLLISQLNLNILGSLMGGWWRWALVSPDGVAPSRMVCVSASVNLPLHRKVQKFSSGTGSPGWSQKRAVKRLWCGGVVESLIKYLLAPGQSSWLIIETSTVCTLPELLPAWRPRLMFLSGRINLCLDHVLGLIS